MKVIVIFFMQMEQMLLKQVNTENGELFQHLKQYKLVRNTEQALSYSGSLWPVSKLRFMTGQSPKADVAEGEEHPGDSPASHPVGSESGRSALEGSPSSKKRATIMEKEPSLRELQKEYGWRWIWNSVFYGNNINTAHAIMQSRKFYVIGGLTDEEFSR